MWTVKTKVIPLIPEATGTFSKSLRKCQRNILGRQDIKELQTTVILSTTQSLESSNAKVQKIQHGK